MVSNKKNQKMKQQQQQQQRKRQNDSDKGSSEKVKAAAPQPQQSKQKISKKGVQHEQPPVSRSAATATIKKEKVTKIVATTKATNDNNNNKTTTKAQQQQSQSLANNHNNTHSSVGSNNNDKNQQNTEKKYNNNINGNSNRVENPQPQTLTTPLAVESSENLQTPKKIAEKNSKNKFTYYSWSHSYAQTVGQICPNSKQEQQHQQQHEMPQQNSTNVKSLVLNYNDNNPLPGEKRPKATKKSERTKLKSLAAFNDVSVSNSDSNTNSNNFQSSSKLSPGDMLTAALLKPCAKCLKPIANQLTDLLTDESFNLNNYEENNRYNSNNNNNKNPKQYRKSKSYVSSRYLSSGDYLIGENRNVSGRRYYRSHSDRRNSFDRYFAERNKDFVPIEQPARPILASSNIHAVIADTEKFVILERLGKGRSTYPIMQALQIITETTKKNT